MCVSCFFQMHENALLYIDTMHLKPDNVVKDTPMSLLLYRKYEKASHKQTKHIIVLTSIFKNYNCISILTSSRILLNRYYGDGSFYFSLLYHGEMNFYHWQKMYQAPRFSQQTRLSMSYCSYHQCQMKVDHQASIDSGELLLYNPASK